MNISLDFGWQHPVHFVWYKRCPGHEDSSNHGFWTSGGASRFVFVFCCNFAVSPSGCCCASRVFFCFCVSCAFSITRSHILSFSIRVCFQLHNSSFCSDVQCSTSVCSLCQFFPNRSSCFRHRILHSLYDIAGWLPRRMRLAIQKGRPRMVCVRGSVCVVYQ